MILFRTYHSNITQCEHPALLFATAAVMVLLVAPTAIPAAPSSQSQSQMPGMLVRNQGWATSTLPAGGPAYLQDSKRFSRSLSWHGPVAVAPHKTPQLLARRYHMAWWGYGLLDQHLKAHRRLYNRASAKRAPNSCTRTDGLWP